MSPEAVWPIAWSMPETLGQGLGVLEAPKGQGWAEVTAMAAEVAELAGE